MSSSCCGSGCKCGGGCGSNSCGCGKKNPDRSAEEGFTTSKTMILGVAPHKGHVEELECARGAENGGCKCGTSCTCDSCNCK